jgi:4-hydroxy-tetrahydrodipicolinate reductase
MKVVVAGASGRMGRTLVELILKSGDLTLAGAIEAPGSPALGKDAGELVGSACGVKISAQTASALAGADCLIDFTTPEATIAHAEECAKARVRMVIGTTGFSDDQKARIAAAATRVGIVFAPNMAAGVNVLMKLAETTAKVLGDAYDVEIIEAHHRHKVDAPSGTALQIGEIVAAALGRNFGASAVHGRKGAVGKRDARSIGFHAVRGGDIVGEHTVLFAGEGERVELTVRSTSRATYAQGALRACRFLKEKTSGLYDMQDVLGLK